MPNNRLARKPKAQAEVAEVPKLSNQSANRVEVTHGNAPLLTVKFLDMILIELRKITEKLEKDFG